MNVIFETINDLSQQEWLKYAILFLLLLVVYKSFSKKIENLRIQGSFDVRGDPIIPFTPVSPWNNPTSFPKRRRRMIIGESY